MTAALLLARQGRSVGLVEASPRLAPTVRGFKRKGVQFDTGMHSIGGLGQGHPLHTYFAHLGVNEQIIARPYSTTDFDHFINEKTHTDYPMACGDKQFVAQLAQFFPEEQRAIQTYVTAVRQAFNDSPFLNFSLELDYDHLLNAETVTLQEFLDSITDNEELKTVLCYQNILYGVPPERTLFANHAMVAGSYLLSTHTIEGGGKALVKAYEAALNQTGVNVYLKSPVSSVNVTENRTIEGVTLGNGTKLATKSCVWTAHPTTLIDAVPDATFRPAFRRRLTTLESTPSCLILFGISESMPPSLDGKNIISWPGTPMEQCLSGELPVNETLLYISAAQDPESGKAAITAIAPRMMQEFPERGNDYATKKDQLFKEMEKDIFQRFPDLQKTVTFIEGATPRTMEYYSNAPGGTMYGLMHTVDQFNPAPVTKVEGLTLAGQSIVAPGILGAVVSAYLTCGIILGHETLQKELRQHV